MKIKKENNHLEDWEESIIELAKELHYKYEEFAEQEKWATNYFCNKMSFDNLPIKNQRVMLKMADLVNNKFKESQVGMIKIEDVEKILAKYLEDENCDYETWNVEELYEGIKTDLDKLKELGEK